ncbi:uncharacterized protein H6S33_005279 [Morchella sextelata]|uniref:uncharacterized protein n=1 Tax=Morchella sextelata TaxID=1174677 RepID=UPI001D04446D|nr:uncharacterized protein H6S33_005279 [Morchella sextelata]KAH0605297.1 hypothetical protein H6S33_005279 [Morchella sextelata]
MAHKGRVPVGPDQNAVLQQQLPFRRISWAVLALGDRLIEEIDVRTVADCARFKVPLFIVRSKAGMHILKAQRHEGARRLCPHRREPGAVCQMSQ